MVPIGPTGRSSPPRRVDGGGQVRARPSAAPPGLLIDSPHQTKGVTRRITKDPEPIFAHGLVDAGCAELTDSSFGFVDVVDEDVEVKLLRAAGVGESRWSVLRRVLEREPATIRIGRHHPRVVHDVDGATEHAGVERRQTPRILAVDHHRAKSSDHGTGITDPAVR